MIDSHTSWISYRGPTNWAYQLISGSGWYHLYFLLVTLQFGVVFPLVLCVLLRTRGHHRWLVSASLVVQLLTLAAYHEIGYPGGLWRGVLGDASLIAYQFWLVAGAIAGLSLDRWHSWILAHRRWILAALPLAATGLLITYYAHVPHRGAVGASDPLQPAMLAWSAIVLGALYLAAVWLAQRRSPHLRTAVAFLARLSFGIYLVHPLALEVVLAVLRHTGLFTPRPWVAGLSFAATIVLTIAACAAIDRTRFSQALIGRPSAHTPAAAGRHERNERRSPHQHHRGQPQPAPWPRPSVLRRAVWQVFVDHRAAQSHSLDVAESCRCGLVTVGTEFSPVGESDRDRLPSY